VPEVRSDYFCVCVPGPGGLHLNSFESNLSIVNAMSHELNDALSTNSMIQFGMIPGGLQLTSLKSNLSIFHSKSLAYLESLCVLQLCGLFG